MPMSGIFYVGFPRNQKALSLHELYSHPGRHLTQHLKNSGINIEEKADYEVCNQSINKDFIT
jgi:hypothetical protein